MNTELPEITGTHTMPDGTSMPGSDHAAYQDMMMRKGQEQQPPQRMPLPDNEPRMEDRSLANQMFTIDTDIKLLMKEYDMVVRNQEFGRAQEIADEIGMLDVQKSQLQAGFALPKTQTMAQQQQSMAQQQPMQPNRQPEEIQQILDSISK